MGISDATALAGSQMGLAGNILGSLASIANASNSDAQSSGFGDSWNASQSASSAIQDSWAWANSDSYGYNNSDSWSQGNAYNHVYGTEASAADIQRALEANIYQENLWKNQAAFNAAEAAKNRKFQQEMANTAYQRAVADLKKAGLNPILAAMNMGATTPSGATASSGLASANKATTYADSTGWSNSASAASSRAESQSTGRSRSGSHAESSSWSSSAGGSHSENQSTSQTRTQLMSLVDAVSGLMNNASAWDQAPKVRTGVDYGRKNYSSNVG